MTTRLFHPLITSATVVIIAGILAWAWIRRADGRSATAPATPAARVPAAQTPAAGDAVAADPVAPLASPTIEAAQQELHGVLRGEPFWCRLLPSDKGLNGRRVLHLVYSPPSIAELGGAQLSDTPYVLLDDHARVVAWNGRHSLSNVHPHRAKDGYRIVREIPRGEGEAAQPGAEERRIAGPMAYDLRLAPVLLALVWRSGSQGAVPVVDLFGARHDERIELKWNGAEATIGAEAWRIEADEAGRLRRIVAADGTAIIEVAGRG
ncbi:MAG TPA: hypothetical protein VEL07_04460 [Planctomycetota bacterium]|nr:hypothetical protein [Planctomycetota bacterium]